jgi:hypothetical protein
LFLFIPEGPGLYSGVGASSYERIGCSRSPLSTHDHPHTKVEVMTASPQKFDGGVSTHQRTL